MNKIEEVKLAKKGTLMYEFQSERTKAIDEMFDNPDKYGIYPTSKFFVKLDNCVQSLIQQAVDEVSKIAIEAILRSDHTNDFNSLENYEKALWKIIELFTDEEKIQLIKNEPDVAWQILIGDDTIDLFK